MKAVLVNSDRSLYLGEVPDPLMGEEDCLVRVEYAGINRADLLQREGRYPPPPGAPEWMGLEISGVIIDMAPGAKEKSPLRIGDRVCALLGGGGYAEYVSVKADMLMPVPENCSMAEAAALPEAFATAYLNLFIEGGLRSGDTLLMQAGASGLASVVIPMAKAFGARVITTINKEHKRAAVEKTGADRIINTATEDLCAALEEEQRNGHPVDVALDCLGGELMGKCLHYLSHGARWIMIAALAGTHTGIDLRNIYSRNVRIIGSTLRSRKPEYKAELLARLVREIWPMVAAGTIRPTLYRILPLSEAEEAQAILYRGEQVGKVILRVWDR